MKKTLFSISVSLFGFVGIAFAQGPVHDLNSLVDFIIRNINKGIGLIMAFATIFFVYNIVVYFVVKTEGDRAEAGRYLLFSIIGLAVILSFWGLVNVVISTFGLNNNVAPNVQNLYFKQ